MILVLQVVAVLLELLANGLSKTESVEAAATRFGLDPDKIKRWL